MTPHLRTLLRTGGVALGATSIYLLWLLAPLIIPTHNAVYHWSGPPAKLFLPPTVDFCAFWLLLTSVFVLTQTPGRARRVVWCGTIAFTPWIAIKNGTAIANVRPNHAMSLALLGMALFAFLFSLAIWRPAFEERFEQAVRITSTLFLLTAISGVLSLCAVAWFGWQARLLNAKLTLHHAHGEPTHEGRPRIIWIVFDELSHQQVYEHRFPGLRLPAFDALAAQATVFTHTIPAGIRTALILPSLMTGMPVDEIRSSSDGRSLSIHNSTAAAWQPFNDCDTVFQDALDLNYGTGVAGWYIPYCRILPDVLDRCFWIFGEVVSNGAFPRETLRSNLMTPLMMFAGSGLGYRFASLFHQVPDISKLDAEQHIFDYMALESAADRILEDRSAGFALIHLPVPHPGGIYDRRTGRFATKHSSYLDNLALADELLGHIRSKLERTGEWDASTIVLMGDHSWRTELIWRDSPGWTEEEQIASHGGQFDDRPAYVVKLPEQHIGARIDEPFAALNTRRLFDALLAQKIRSKEELSVWALQGGH